MFTGLIEDVGRVAEISQGVAARLTVTTSLDTADIREGDSIAVNGACLTVVAKEGDHLTFDVSPETLSRTGLARLRPGSEVNLERALRLGDRLGGHLVSGHVDCLATVMERKETAENIFFSFRIPRTASRYLAEKGSVTIDGVSLTVNAVSAESFSVNIIPHTAAMTTLRSRRVGDTVAIETDLLAKYVERLLGSRSGADGGVTLELLAKNGFL